MTPPSSRWPFSSQRSLVSRPLDRFARAGALAAAAPLAACTVSTTPEPAPGVVTTAAPAGTLQLDWTIDGVADPAKCSQSQSDSIQIIVDFTDGAQAGVFQQSCAAFATSVTLEPGSYTASAMLLHPGGAPRTTAVTVNPFTIHGNDTVAIPVDFPASSFY
jgi:hypothetical protein